MPDDDFLYNLADFFKVFSDATRVKILFALLDKELCVNDIADVINTNQSAVSHQLRILKQMKFVKYRRDGKSMLYSLADDHISTILNQGFEHLNE